jgi:hypothetical protein
MLYWKEDTRSNTGLIFGTIPEFVLRDEEIRRKMIVK